MLKSKLSLFFVNEFKGSIKAKVKKLAYSRQIRGRGIGTQTPINGYLAKFQISILRRGGR